MIKPIFTEKSLKLAKEGRYSFWAERTLDKSSAKAEIAKTFGVHVISINTSSGRIEQKRNTRGFKFLKSSPKKVIVTLKSGEKIDLFEEGKSK